MRQAFGTGVEPQPTGVTKGDRDIGVEVFNILKEYSPYSSAVAVKSLTARLQREGFEVDEREVENALDVLADDAEAITRIKNGNVITYEVVKDATGIIPPTKTDVVVLDRRRQEDNSKSSGTIVPTGSIEKESTSEQLELTDDEILVLLYLYQRQAANKNVKSKHGNLERLSSKEVKIDGVMEKLPRNINAIVERLASHDLRLVRKESSSKVSKLITYVVQQKAFPYIGVEVQPTKPVTVEVKVDSREGASEEEGIIEVAPTPIIDSVDTSLLLGVDDVELQEPQPEMLKPMPGAADNEAQTDKDFEPAAPQPDRDEGTSPINSNPSDSTELLVESEVGSVTDEEPLEQIAPVGRAELVDDADYSLEWIEANFNIDEILDGCDSNKERVLALLRAGVPLKRGSYKSANKIVALILDSRDFNTEKLSPEIHALSKGGFIDLVKKSLRETEEIKLGTGEMVVASQRPQIKNKRDRVNQKPKVRSTGDVRLDKFIVEIKEGLGPNQADLTVIGYIGELAAKDELFVTKRPARDIARHSESMSNIVLSQSIEKLVQNGIIIRRAVSNFGHKFTLSSLGQKIYDNIDKF